MDRVLRLKPTKEAQKNLRNLLMRDEGVRKSIYERIGKAIVAMMDEGDRTPILEEIMEVYYSVAVMCYDHDDSIRCLNRMTQDIIERRFEYKPIPKTPVTVDYVDVTHLPEDLGNLGDTLKDMADKIGAIQAMLKLLVIFGTYQTMEDAFEHFADETNMRESLSDEAYDTMRRNIVDE